MRRTGIALFQMRLADDKYSLPQYINRITLAGSALRLDDRAVVLYPKLHGTAGDGTSLCQGQLGIVSHPFAIGLPGDFPAKMVKNRKDIPPSAMRIHR
ncbi:MAG TPA: hypothetical protein VIW23_13865, partial [Candidatus Acidoferrum sp.]